MKRLLTLALALLLCLSVFAGCNTPQTPQTPDETNTPEPPEDVIDDYDNENEIEIGGEQPEAGSEHTNTIGKFVAKDKTYDYQGNNVTILTLENQSEANCTVTIHAKFLNAYGIVLKTETQSFEGFPAGWQNHFVFMPQIQYDAMEYTLDVKQYTGEMYFTVDSHNTLTEVYEDKIPLPQTLAQRDYEKYSSILAKFDGIMPETPYLKRLVSVVFDNNGEIAVINTQRGQLSGGGYYQVLVYAPSVPTKEPLDWPEELDGGVTGIVGILQDEMIE
ncbi:MAG: hypothetical protein IJW40_05165 [Clostridia bacterium]|nr:hypothetical protein [Clostridia bacterium]